MSSKSELRQKVLQLLKVMSQSQNIVECIKQALVMHEEFSPITLFQTISMGKQRATKSDLKRFLDKNSIQFNQQELRQYMRQKQLGKEFTFHQFIETLLPFNADALRVYKEYYLEKLSFKQQDLEVEIIYRELLSNQLRFVRSINVIKNQICNSCQGQIWRVSQLIKTDLVGRSKIREAKKFEEKFDDPKEEISFIDLRRFLELHNPTHQVVLLNLMRKLKADNPLKPINLRLQNAAIGISRSKSKNRSRDKGVDRSRSKNKNSGKNQTQNYENFKKQLQKQYEVHQSIELNKSGKKQKKQKTKTTSSNRRKREEKNIDGELLKKLFQAIISEEEEIEKHRRKLYQAKEFNMINLFKLIDENRAGALSQQNLLKFVNKYSGSKVSSLKQLFSKFSKQKGGIRFHELYLILQPLSKQLVKNINNKQQDPLPNPFRQKTLEQVANIIVLTVNALKLIQSLKEQINDKGQDVDELFEYIDIDNKGVIVSQNIKKLLDQDEFFSDHKDMKLLFKYFDRRPEEKIEIGDFRKFIQV